jgi:hypothetical protein
LNAIFLNHRANDSVIASLLPLLEFAISVSYMVVGFFYMVVGFFFQKEQSLKITNLQGMYRKSKQNNFLVWIFNLPLKE